MIIHTVSYDKDYRQTATVFKVPKKHIIAPVLRSHRLLTDNWEVHANDDATYDKPIH
jgi:hypothetical protein